MRRGYVVPMGYMVIHEYGVPGGALNLNSTNYPDIGHHGDPPLSRKNPHGRVGNRTRDLLISSQKHWPLDHKAGHIMLYSVTEICQFNRNCCLCLHCRRGSRFLQNINILLPNYLSWRTTRPLYLLLSWSHILKVKSFRNMQLSSHYQSAFSKVWLHQSKFDDLISSHRHTKTHILFCILCLILSHSFGRWVVMFTVADRPMGLTNNNVCCSYS
jgi:hypothetical protein